MRGPSYVYVVPQQKLNIVEINKKKKVISSQNNIVI